MIYKVDCANCGKEGNRGFYSKSYIPDGWILLSWMSKHSEHVEAVCSVECLHSFEFHPDDIPTEKTYE